jgi:hypothetical protein
LAVAARIVLRLGRSPTLLDRGGFRLFDPETSTLGLLFIFAGWTASISASRDHPRIFIE